MLDHEVCDLWFRQAQEVFHSNWAFCYVDSTAFSLGAKLITMVIWALWHGLVRSHFSHKCEASRLGINSCVQLAQQLLPIQTLKSQSSRTVCTFFQHNSIRTSRCLRSSSFCFSIFSLSSARITSFPPSTEIWEEKGFWWFGVGFESIHLIKIPSRNNFVFFLTFPSDLNSSHQNWITMSTHVVLGILFSIIPSKSKFDVVGTKLPSQTPEISYLLVWQGKAANNIGLAYNISSNCGKPIYIGSVKLRDIKLVLLSLPCKWLERTVKHSEIAAASSLFFTPSAFVSLFHFNHIALSRSNSRRLSQIVSRFLFFLPKPLQTTTWFAHNWTSSGSKNKDQTGKDHELVPSVSRGQKSRVTMHISY